MKKLVQIITAAIIGVGFIGSVASAQQAPASCGNIVIVNNGNNSNVNGTCTVNVVATATCTNNVYVLDANAQQAASGAASVIGNVSQGAAITGSATNSNNSNQTVTIGGPCGAAVTPSPSVSVSPSVTPASSVTPGKGAATPTVLPYTAGNSAAEIVAISLTAAAGVVVASRLAIAAYRRFSVK